LIYLPLMIIIPLIGTLLLASLGQSRRLIQLIDCSVFAVMLLSSLLIAARTWSGSVLTYSIGSWPPGLGLGLVTDMFGGLMLVMISTVAALSLTYSFGEFQGRQSTVSFHLLVMLLVMGLNGVVLSTDLFNLFIFVELASVSAFALVGFGGGETELEASIKYAILATLSGLIFLGGIGLMYDQAGTLNLGAMAERMGEPSQEPLVKFSSLMIMIGIALPTAAFPLHTWLPDAHSRAPTAISAMLSAVSVQVAIFALFRIFYQSLFSSVLLRIVFWVGAITTLFGAMLALLQVDLKRLLAYATVSSCGLSLLLIGSQSISGFQGLILQMANHGAAKALLFLSAGCLIQGASERELAKMGGSWVSFPGICLAFLIGVLADLGGASVGLFAKAYAFFAILEAEPLALLLVAPALVITAAAYVKVFQSFMGERGRGEERGVSLWMKLPTLLLAGYVALSSLGGWLVLGAVRRAAVQMINGSAMLAMSVI